MNKGYLHFICVLTEAGLNTNLLYLEKKHYFETIIHSVKDKIVSEN